MHRLARALAATGCAAVLPALAQTDTTSAEPRSVEPVVVSASRLPEPAFASPSAISLIDERTLREAGPGINLSEALNRAPGVVALNRQNYAQDLQISIRGFGSRATFGIRGVRLMVDGIPASMPDGQGQVSNVVLSSAGRIEVLRGPMAQLYGNAAGGVIQVFSATPPEGHWAGGNLTLGQDGLWKAGFSASTRNERNAFLLDVSRFNTDGWRPRSAAQRDQLNLKWDHQTEGGSRVGFVLNALDQPDNQDPLGLTRAAFDANPRQAAAIGAQQKTGKTVRQQQGGATLTHSFTDSTSLNLRAHFGLRSLDNTLSIPLAAQQAPTSAGGIVDFSRNYGGFSVQLAHEGTTPWGAPVRGVAGIENEYVDEDRQGYINDTGQRGLLKRNEINRVQSTAAFAQGTLGLTRTVDATLGVRSNRVSFNTQDLFIAPGNPDDSGSLSYAATLPVLGLAWRAAPTLNLYANAGRGFETPTLTELAYRTGGTGFNTALRASTSRHAELGAKWRGAGGLRVDMAAFRIETRDEIVVETNSGGRSTFRNAAQTTREGLELAVLAPLGRFVAGEWQLQLSASPLRARYSAPFVSGSGATVVQIPAGNRLPGTPELTAFAELTWRGTGLATGWSAALEAQHTSKLFVNDANTDAAAAVNLLNARAGWSKALGNWRIDTLLRVDNLTDRRYAGSVIVNEANGRFFEPGLPRRVSGAVRLSQRF
ncbi:TonB-dependent receptor family protein [Piscinibacterium candidicorallinum]|uniref:TonB-dependent receptor family protein n=1 Tax=Piscinibacterium candidicorallinum TaxID=1793872 RepID=A0ABV7H4C1_9BURK